MALYFNHSDDSYSAPDPVPSSGELSCLLADPDVQPSLRNRFIRRQTQSVTLCYYQILSENITRLEEDIERHVEECNTLWEHLFESNSFRTRIRPVVRQYRHKLALIRWGFHPYGRPTTTPSPSTSNSSPSSSGIHLGPIRPRPSTSYPRGE
jgi:hypothetical protein